MVQVNWDKVPPGERWQLREPLALVPVPAADVRPLKDRNVIVHDPVLRGWSYEFRAATEPHLYDGSPHVGILAIADWYRAKADRSFIAVPRPMPIDRVWVETEVDVPLDDDEPQLTIRDTSATIPAARNARRLVDASRPPGRRLRRGLFEETVHGRRAALVDPETPIWPVRVCSEPYWDDMPEVLNMSAGPDEFGKPVQGPVVSVCAEGDWWLWHSIGRKPEIIAASLFRVWVA